MVPTLPAGSAVFMESSILALPRHGAVDLAQSEGSTAITAD
jgi:hypothetical protein